MQQNSDIVVFAKDLAREAGTIISNYFYGKNLDIEMKSDATPVTIADKQINQMVIDRVTATFPDHGVLAEEGSSHADRSQLWVCDPLDGTKSFIQHIPVALFSLAYVVDGVTEVGVIYDPFQDKLYSAAKGEGAFCNDVALHVTNKSELTKANVAGVTGYREIQDRKAFFNALLEQGANQVIVPGSAFKGSLVANGGIDAFIFPGKSAHDIAAVKLIVEEAGGKVTNLRGEEQRYDQPIYGAIVSNGNLHEHLAALLKEFGPENYIGY